MPSESLLLEVDDRVAILTINRPTRRNALDAALIREIDAVFSDLLTRPDVGGVVLTGTGTAFAAGADIAELAALSPDGARDLSRAGQATFGKFAGSPRPVVAAVNGFALGGGCELAMACHVRIAADTASLGQPEVKLGLIPGYGGTVRLPLLVGPGRAAQLLLTGELIDATEAFRIGLVNSVVPAADVVNAAVSTVRRMLANGPLALAAVLAALPEAPAAALEAEAEAFARLFGTADSAEGMAAFLARRPAAFSGR